MAATDAYALEFPNLAPQGLYAAETLGNGNCLFHALSDQMYGNQGHHAELRASTVSYMRQYAQDYKAFIVVHSGGGSRRNPKRKNVGGYAATKYDSFPPTSQEVDRAFETYLARMGQKGTYGDNMEIVAFSEMFNVCIRIYLRDLAYIVQKGTGEQGTYHIAYHETWEHYSSIRNLDGPHTGLPMVNPHPLPLDAQNPPPPAVMDWQVKIVRSSLPYATDQAIIIKALQECKGNINNAVDKILSAEDLRNTSSQPSSSAERDDDSSDEAHGGPAKKQDRRVSRLSHNAQNPDDSAHRQALDGTVDKRSDSLESLLNAASASSAMHVPGGVNFNLSNPVDSDDDSIVDPLKDGDTTSDSDYTPPTEEIPQSEPSGIKIHLSRPPDSVSSNFHQHNAPSAASLEHANDPATPKPSLSKSAKKRIHSRDRHRDKWAASKQARRERLKAKAQATMRQKQFAAAGTPQSVAMERSDSQPTMTTGFQNIHL